MAMNVPSYNPLACSAMLGHTITYRRDPDLLGFAYPPPTTQGDIPTPTGQNHVRDNVWKGIVLGCASMPTSTPVGQVDPVSGAVVQAVYQVQDPYAHFNNGYVEVKASNVIDTGCDAPDTAEAVTAVRQRGLQSAYLRDRFGAGAGTPSDLYLNLRR